MSDKEFMLIAACVAAIFTLFYGVVAVAAVASDQAGNHESFAHRLLGTMLPITQSLGILWPLAGILLLGSFIFTGVAASQGIDAVESKEFTSQVLFYSAALTLIFASPLIGMLIGRISGPAILRVFRLSDRDPI